MSCIAYYEKTLDKIIFTKYNLSQLPVLFFKFIRLKSLQKLDYDAIGLIDNESINDCKRRLD